MINIGFLLGWKYDHAEGICTRNGEITAWPEHLGPVPNAAKLEDILLEYEAEAQKRESLEEIKRLENLETPRRIAEAALDTPLVNDLVYTQATTGKDWLQINRDLIALERAKL